MVFVRELDLVLCDLKLRHKAEAEIYVQRVGKGESDLGFLVPLISRGPVVSGQGKISSQCASTPWVFGLENCKYWLQTLILGTSIFQIFVSGTLNRYLKF